MGQRPEGPAWPRQATRRTLLGRGGLALGVAAAGVVATGHDAVLASGRRAPASTGLGHRSDDRLRQARLVWRVPTSTPVVALTFDDGPLPDYTDGVLDALDRLRVRATFYLVGGRAARHPDLVRREVGHGHELGNHSFTHPDLSQASASLVRDELRRTSDVIAKLAGATPRTLRPPYGNVCADTLVAAGELGYDVIVWSVGISDSLRDIRQGADQTANLGPGSVILAHDAGKPSRWRDLDALPRLVARARELGLRFVTISELLALADPPGTPATAGRLIPRRRSTAPD